MEKAFNLAQEELALRNVRTVAMLDAKARKGMMRVISWNA